MFGKEREEALRLKSKIEMNSECGKCDDQFDTKAKLDKHQKLHCDVCGEIFTTILQLKKHESECERCDFKADHLKSFLYHLTTEHLRGTELFKCSDFLC